MLRKILYSTLIVFAIFMFINITGSMLPIGVGSVGEMKLSSHQIDDFDYSQSSMQLIRTDNRMNLISSRPSSYYSINKFHNRGMFFSLLSAFLLSIILYTIQGMESKIKLLICSVFGFLVITSVHLNYWNWWGFSTIYTIGVSLSSFLSIILSCMVVNRLFFRNSNNIKTV